MQWGLLVSLESRIKSKSIIVLSKCDLQLLLLIQQKNLKNMTTKFQYTGTLLPSEDYSAVINGNLTDKAINFLREPPLITFSKERGQFTTFCIEILQSPLSKTDINLKIEDYLLERIARIKHGTGQPKILYKTIADNIGIKNMTIDNQRNLKKKIA